MATLPKIGILTFHRCINYGSYWQARCLIEGLRGMGADAVLLDHDSAAVNRREWRCALDPQHPRMAPMDDRRRNVEKTRRFLDALAQLPRSDRFDLDAANVPGRWNLVIVGSDEVWNLRHPWYGNHAVFYGCGIDACRLVSYAASFGNQHATAPLSGTWAARLSNFDMISVRDGNSVRLVRDAIGSEPELVLDPCLQFPPAIERMEAASAEHPYIAIYGHTFPQWFSQAVRNWTAARGHRLLSIGYRNDWADEQIIEAGPHRFAQLMADATAVVTNFFHGCIFALLNAKPFACVSSPYRANKVSDLIQLLSAERHLVTEATEPALMQRILRNPIEERVFSRIAELRVQSQGFLEKALA